MSVAPEIPSIGLSSLAMAERVRRGDIEGVRAAPAGDAGDEILRATALHQIGAMGSAGAEPGAILRLENVISTASAPEAKLAARIELSFAQLEAMKPRRPILDSLNAIESELGAVQGPAGDALRARAALVRGRTLLRNRDITGARSEMAKSLALSSQLKDNYGVAEAELALGMADTWNGRPRIAQSHLENAARIWKEQGNTLRLGDVDYETGILAFDTRDFPAARERFDRAREIAEKAGAGSTRLLRIGYQQGAAALAAGDFAGAQEHLSKTREAALKASDSYRSMMCAVDLGRCCIERSRSLQGAERSGVLTQAAEAYVAAVGGLSEQERQPGAFGGLHATLLEAELMRAGIHPDGVVGAMDAADLLGRSADAFATLDRERPRCLMFRLAAAEAYGDAADEIRSRPDFTKSDAETVRLMKERQQGEAASACELAARMGIDLLDTETPERLLRLGCEIESRKFAGQTYVRARFGPKSESAWTLVDDVSDAAPFEAWRTSSKTEADARNVFAGLAQLAQESQKAGLKNAGIAPDRVVVRAQKTPLMSQLGDLQGAGRDGVALGRMMLATTGLPASLTVVARSLVGGFMRTPTQLGDVSFR